MPKITIMQEGMSKRIFLDGKDVSRGITAVDVRIRPDEIPLVTLDMYFLNGFTELSQADAQIRLHPETLQQAAMIIRQEFRKKGTWYNALVTSIAEHLRHVPAGVGLYNTAYSLADLLIGEDENANT